MINMDFSYETEGMLRRNLRWGDIDFEELFKDADLYIPKVYMNDILNNKHAQGAFKFWMKEKLTEDQRFLVRVNYGKGRFPKNIEIPEGVRDNLHYDNEICLRFAFDRIRENIDFGGHGIYSYLFYLLTGSDIATEDDDPDIINPVDVNFEDLWLNIVSLYGLHMVNGDNLRSFRMFECIAGEIEDEMISKAVCFALCGEGEIRYDKYHRIFGINATNFPELYEKCWKYVKKYLTAEMIAAGLKKFLDSAAADYNYSALYLDAAGFALYVFENRVPTLSVWGEPYYPYHSQRGWTIK